MQPAENPKITKTAFSKKVRRVLGLDLHSWEQLMLLSLAAVGIAGVAVAWSTASVVILQRQENAATKQEFETYKIEAGKRSEELKREAAVATARAAEAQLALESFKSARTLTGEQQSRIFDKLKAFSGTTFDAAVGPKGDPEPIVFLRFLELALIRAGWKPVSWAGGSEQYAENGMPSIGLTSVTNVIVEVHSSHWEKLGAAAKALAAALDAEGIDAIARNTSNINSDAIHIRIGRKM